MTLASKPAVYTGYNSTLGKRVRPGYAQAARVRALGPSRANPWAPRRRRVTVSLENEGDSGLGYSDHHDGGGGSGSESDPQILRLPFLCSTPDETDPW